MANNKKFNIDEYTYIGYENYNQYFNKYGKDIDLKISEDANKYLKMLTKEFNIIIDDVQEILDMQSKSTVQNKIVPRLKEGGCLYIVKPVRDLLYSYMNEDQYKAAYSEGTHGYCDLEFESNLHKENIKILKDFRIRKTWLRKRLFFTHQSLFECIEDVFSKESVKIENNKEVVEYEKLSSDEINRIIKNKVLSENAIKDKLNLKNGLQIQRRIKKGDIDLNFRIAMLNEGKRPALVRYSVNL